MRWLALLPALVACGSQQPPQPAQPAPPAASAAPEPPAVSAAPSAEPAPPSANASAEPAPGPEAPTEIASFAKSKPGEGRYVLVGYLTEIADPVCPPCPWKSPECAACPAPFVYLADRDDAEGSGRLYVNMTPGQVPADLLHQRIRAAARVIHGPRPVDRYVTLISARLASALPEPIPPGAIQVTIVPKLIPAPRPPPPLPRSRPDRRRVSCARVWSIPCVRWSSAARPTACASR